MIHVYKKKKKERELQIFVQRVQNVNMACCFTETKVFFSILNVKKGNYKGFKCA